LFSLSTIYIHRRADGALTPFIRSPCSSFDRRFAIANICIANDHPSSIMITNRDRSSSRFISCSVQTPSHTLHRDIPRFVQFRTSRILRTSASDAIVFWIRTARERIYVPTQLSPIDLRFLYHRSISLWIPQLHSYGTASLIFLAHELLSQSWSGSLQLKIRRAMPVVNTGFNVWLAQYVCTSICQIIRCLPFSPLQL
jgi:hypothetical protein